MDKESMNILKSLSLPLIKFLNEKCNPHCKIELSDNGVKVIEDVCSIPIK